MVLFFVVPISVTAQKKRKTVKKHIKKDRKVKKIRRVAHCKYRHLPKRGRTVKKVGVGYVGIRFKNTQFRVHKGVWYRPKGSGFLVTRAPLGIRVKLLPLGHRRMILGTKIYFYYYGTYYAQTEDSNAYEVVEAPLGAQIDALPEGYETVEINGQEYYKIDDTFYEFIESGTSGANYLVVEAPNI